MLGVITKRWNGPSSFPTPSSVFTDSICKRERVRMPPSRVRYDISESETKI